MTDTSKAQELTDAIMERAHLLAEVQVPSEQLAEIDWDQFAIGAIFATGAAFLVLSERGLLHNPNS